MTRSAAELYQVFVLCALLSCVASLITAHRYRRRMQRLMRASSPEDSRPSNAPAAEATGDRLAAAAVSLADNRAAGMRLTLQLIASSCLLAGTSACIFSALMFPAEPLMLWRVIPIAVLHLWPVIPAIALMWCWSRARFLRALLLWCAATWVVLFVIGLWRHIDMGPLLVLQIMASEIGLSLALLSLVFLGEATRAIAPWLLVPAALLTWSSLAGVAATSLVETSIANRSRRLVDFFEASYRRDGVVETMSLSAHDRALFHVDVQIVETLHVHVKRNCAPSLMPLTSLRSSKTRTRALLVKPSAV